MKGFEAYAFPRGVTADLAAVLDRQRHLTHQRAEELQSKIDRRSIAAEQLRRLSPSFDAAPLLSLWLEEAFSKNEIALQRHLEVLPHLLLARVARGEWTLRLTRGRFARSVGLGWRLEAKRSKRLILRVEKTQSSLRDGSKTVAEIPDTELRANATGDGVVVHDRALISVSKRSLVRGEVELLPLEELLEVLGGSKRSQWRSESGDFTKETSRALALFEKVWPAAFADVEAFCKIIVPLRGRRSTLASVANPTLPFAIGLTFTPSPLSSCELILHEVCHVKLDLLRRHDPLIDDDHQAKHRHPWREELRPLMGVLFGTHAFLAIAALFGRAIRAGLGAAKLKSNFDLRRAEVGRMLEYLRRTGRFTAVGRRLLDSMSEEHAQLTH